MYHANKATSRRRSQNYVILCIVPEGLFHSEADRGAGLVSSARLPWIFVSFLNPTFSRLISLAPRPSLVASLGLAMLLAGVEAVFLIGFRWGLTGATWWVLPVLLACAALRLPLQWAMAESESRRATTLARRLRLRLQQAFRRHHVSCELRNLRVTLRVLLSSTLPRVIEGSLAGRQALGAFLQLALLIPVAIWAAPRAAWLFLPLGLPAYALARWKARTLRRQAAALRLESEQGESQMEAWIEGLEGLMANGALSQALGQDQRQTARQNQLEGQSRVAQQVFPAGLEFFFFTGLSLIAWWASRASNLWAESTAGLQDWVVLGGALLLTYRPVRELGRAWPQWATGRAMAGEIEKQIQAWRSLPMRRRPAAASTFPLPALQLRQVTFGYSQSDTANADVFKACDLTFPLHRITGVTGPNGAGKTTLLRLLAGLELPLSGQVLWPPSLRDYGNVAYLPQRLWLPREFLSRIEQQKKKHSQRYAELDTLLGTSNLLRRLNLDVRELSGGERQRLALLLTLLSDSPFLLLDEPTSFLPGKDRRNLLSALLTVWRNADGPEAPRRGGVVVAHESFLPELCEDMLELQAPMLPARVAAGNE